MPTPPSFPETETSSHSPVQHAKSDIDGISEGTEKTGNIKAVQSVAEAGGVNVNSGMPRVWNAIEEERRGPS
jgi:hypothetical protein